MKTKILPLSKHDSCVLFKLYYSLIYDALGTMQFPTNVLAARLQKGISGVVSKDFSCTALKLLFLFSYLKKN